MSLSPTAPRPVRVTMAHECEVVSRGVEEMLASYPRVELVRPNADGFPALEVVS